MGEVSLSNVDMQELSERVSTLSEKVGALRRFL